MNQDRSTTITNSQIKEGYKQTEVGIIPEDWIIKSLGAITDPQRPISYGIVQTGSQVFNGVPCLRVVDINNGKINRSDFITTSQEISNSYKRTILKIGDLVMPLRGKVGDTAIIDKELSGANLTRGLALIALEKEWSNNYLHQNISFSKSKARLAQSLNGSALQELPIATLRAFKIAFPPTRLEQEAIACTLSDIDALIESLDRLLTKKRQIKQGAMQELLRSKDCWVENKLGDLFDISAGGDLRKNEFSTEQDENYQFPIYSNAITEHGLYGYCSTKDYSGNCITITARGSTGHAVFRNNDFAAIGRLLILEPIGNTNCMFVAEYINLWINFANESTGVPQLTVPQASKYVVQLPEITEQIEIANILSDMDAEIGSISAKLTKTRQLKQGMIHELLTGRIRLVDNTSIS